MNYSKLPPNAAGYVAANRAFTTLRAAEIYCNENDFDVAIIQIDIAAAKVIARGTVAACEMLAELLQKQYDAYSRLLEVQERKLDGVRALKQTFATKIDMELALENFMALANTRSGVAQAMKTVSNERLAALSILSNAGGSV